MRQVRRAEVAVGLALASYWAPALCEPLPAARRLFGVRDRVAPGPHVALTFDDGPHRQGTPAVLDALAAAGATATFFLVGEQVDADPGLAAEIVAAGHELGVHGYRHRNLMFRAPGATRDDLDRAWEAIAAATGREARVYRPPYGILSAAALATARSRSWEVVLWRTWAWDWSARATPKSIAARVARAEAGDVVLLHDADHYSASGSWARTAAAMPTVLDDLALRGLSTLRL